MELTDYINYNKTEECIKSLYNLTNIPIKVVDLRGKNIVECGFNGAQNKFDDVLELIDNKEFDTYFTVEVSEDTIILVFPISMMKMTFAYLITGEIDKNNSKFKSIKTLLFYFRDFISYYAFNRMQFDEVKAQFEFLIDNKEEGNILSEAKYKEKMFKLAYYDSLTGLPKKNYFRAKIREYIHSKKSNFSILLFDIDEFKKINDNFGYSVGDEWLKYILEEIKKILNENELIFKWGGDEYIILLNTTNKRYIASKAEKVLKICSKPYYINDRIIQLSASIGISIYSEGDDIDSFVKKADIAMHVVKSSGKNSYTFFNQDMQKDIESKLQLETDLKRAIANKEFVLYFQPLFSLKECKIIGFEALVRWKHPDKGMISPGVFIPLAEETGLIRDIGNIVIKEAFKQVKKWENTPLGNVKISINISDIQLRDENFIDFVKNSVNKYKINPKNITFEVTETVMMKSFERNIEIFKELQNMGIQVALDDFGTGYSSLGYLKKLPIDIIKIDKIFIDNIHNQDTDRSFVDGIISLIHKMNMYVVAEGVELMEQMNILKEKGCDIIQGYFIGKPMEVNDVEKMLAVEGGIK